jgi:hypothetical protein
VFSLVCQRTWIESNCLPFVGVKSIARDTLDKSGKPSFEKTGFAAYRATVDVERIKADAELAWLLQKPALNIWLVFASEVPILRLN